MSDYIIRRELEADRRTVENLTREAFWNRYRPGCTEHYVLHRYRGEPDFVPELDLVIEKDGAIAAHIMYVRAEIMTDDGRVIPIMTFGPVSVDPKYMGKGYGSALINRSLALAGELGAGAVAITGDPGFYSRFGFVAGAERNIRYAAAPSDDPAPYFLIKELEPGFLNGVRGRYADPPGYLVKDDEVDIFDASFPKKEKLRLPGQLI